MTNEAASLSLQCLLLRAVVDSKDELIAKLQRENDWLSLENAALRSGESPNAQSQRLEALRARGFERINDPRRAE